MKLVKKYGRKPIYTDGAMWYTGACKWAGVEHIVFDFNEKGLIERINEYVKDRTEAFDDLFPCRSSFSNCLDHVGNWMAIYSFLYNYAFSTNNASVTPLEAVMRMYKAILFKEVSLS